MRPFRLSRRAALRGAGVSLALPWLEAMTPLVRKAEAAAPKRAIFWFTPNGVVRSNWRPSGTETSWTLSRILKPLEPLKNDINVIDGLASLSATEGGGDGHAKGAGCLLTCVKLASKSGAPGSASPPDATSIDQEIVDRLKPPTRFSSLELGVKPSGGTIFNNLSYRKPAAGGTAKALPVDGSPKSVFTRLFGNGPVTGGDPNAVARLQAERRSVLDAIKRGCETMQPRLGTDDRQRLDGHLTSVRELEKRLFTASATTSTGCAAPSPVDPATGDFRAIGKAQMDLLAMAMACDLTRVSTFMWSHAVGNESFSWIGTGQHHVLSHEPTSNTGAMEQLTKIDTWYSEQLAYFLTKLKGVVEGTGTLLDNTLLVTLNELQNGQGHGHCCLPIVQAGRAGGQIKTGRFLQYPALQWNEANPPNPSAIGTSNLFVSIMNAMGIPATTFGDPRRCTGALARLM